MAIATVAVESSVDEMITFLKQTADKYEDVLENQLEAEKIKTRMNYLNNAQMYSRNIKNIKKLRYSATDYTKHGTFNYANTPKQFGNKLAAMLTEKANKEKIYTEGL